MWRVEINEIVTHRVLSQEEQMRTAHQLTVGALLVSRAQSYAFLSEGTHFSFTYPLASLLFTPTQGSL